MKKVSVKTFIAHKMRDVYVAMTEHDRALVAIGESYTSGEITIRPTTWAWFAYYEGEYGRWQGEYDGVAIKNVKPRGVRAKSLHESKVKVAIGGQ